MSLRRNPEQEFNTQGKEKCSVYVDGSHNPTPHETREAQWLVGIFECNKEEE